MGDHAQWHARFGVPKPPTEASAFFADDFDEVAWARIARSLTDHFRPDGWVEGDIFDLDSRHGGTRLENEGNVDLGMWWSGKKVRQVSGGV